MPRAENMLGIAEGKRRGCPRWKDWLQEKTKAGVAGIIR